MAPVEYRVEYVNFDTDPDAGSGTLQLVTRLNEWAREGWRVACVDLAAYPRFGPQPRPVLLEREFPPRRPGDEPTPAESRPGESNT